MKKSIGIITLPIGKSGLHHLKNFVDLIDPKENNIKIITGNFGINEELQNDIHNPIIGLKNETKQNPIYRIANYIYIQFWIAYQCFSSFKNVDVSIFFLGNSLILPKIVLKIFRIPIVELYAGSPINTLLVEKSPFLFPMKILTFISNEFSDIIILYSPNLVTEWHFERWHDKIKFCSEHHINFNLFHCTNKIQSRDKIIGFVGRFSREKGLLNLIYAIPNIIKKNPGIKFLIIGDGILQKEISDFVKKNNMNDHIILVGWCSQEKMPEYLNRMKLLVLPSYTEGLPNVILEAMACGTPFLVSSVGSIPDIITDKVNGFILKNNNPNSIETEILRILENEDLELISTNAEKYVRDTFSHSATQLRIQKILY